MLVADIPPVPTQETPVAWEQAALRSGKGGARLDGVRNEATCGAMPVGYCALRGLRGLEPHETHFHLYLKPPSPDKIGTNLLLAQADTGVTPATVTDAVDMSPMLLAAAQGAGSVKYDKIVNECNFARTYATDSDMPTMVAQGQYAHNYEETQQLKVIRVEVVRRPKYGDLVPVTSVVRDGKLFPSDTYFEMKATSLDYLGPDLAEYAVELSNGKRVLVRTHIYWVNQETDSFNQCPPTANDYQDMRRIQKKHPEYFKKLNQLDPQNLPAGVLPWLRQVELEDTIAAAYNTNLNFADLPGGAVGRTEGEGDAATITLDDNAAGYGWFVDTTPADNAEFLLTSNPNEWIAKADSEAAGKMDHLSVLLHEYGHALGIDHSADSGDYMAATLQSGVRRLPSSEELALMARLVGQTKEGLIVGMNSDLPGTPPSPSLPIGTTLSALLIGRLRRTDYGSWSPVFDSVQIPAPVPQFEVAANPKLQNPDFDNGTDWMTTGDRPQFMQKQKEITMACSLWTGCSCEDAS